ncbi:trypsin-like serine protease [Lysinibacillus sp. NPDC093197]|uniref:trypsin-like serine protease n=1 Tax=Lysinibacillus sp. NPDC093197 TaxID=3364132 RepID=UPI003826BB90
MDEQFTYSIGKIHCGTKDGSLFLISPIIAITALHVVDEALRYGEEIEVDFPILNCEEVISAKVIYPTSVENTNLPDIAVLELSRPVEVSHLKLARVNIEQDIEWKSFGYPITKEEKGQFFKGTVALTRSDYTSYQYDIDLFCAVPNLTDPKYSAKGASGSPIVIGDYVVGILTDAMPGSTIGMVDIIRIQSLLAEHDINFPFLGNIGKYYNDIRKLRDYTKMLADNNSDYSRLWINYEEVKIDRECVDVIQDEVKNGSLLIIGEPGAGKSGALRDLVVNLDKEKRDVVFLDVGHINAESIGTLREELGISMDLNLVLENWLGEQPGYIVIDALDAARSEKSAQVLRSLISHVHRKMWRWRIIASVRKFDLRHDNELRRLFRGDAITKYQDPEFSNLRHIYISEFSEEETLGILKSAPEIETLLNKADETMKNLIRFPFNLRIISELLDEGIEESELIPIRTQRELLDRYWSYRVIRRDGQRDAREILLTKTVKEMVANKTLRAARSKVVDATTSGTLHDLLSTNVLVEWQKSIAGSPSGYTIAFSHHILFDYAVYRLMMQENPEKIVRLLIDNPDLVLVIRPSFVYLFTNIWYMGESRLLFWDLVFLLIENETIPEVAKLIGPSLAVELGNVVNDFNPLFERLTIQDLNSSKVAELTLSHLIGGFMVVVEEPVKRDVMELWGGIAEILSKNMTISKVVMSSVRLITSALCNNNSDFGMNKNIGLAARRLLEEILEKPEHDWMLNSVITSVCRTFLSNKDESERLLGKFLTPQRIKDKGYVEIPIIASELPILFKHSPSFVKDVYCIAFFHEEKSEESTTLGTSKILPLKSNRRQDYRHALYLLKEEFPNYLEYAPFHALYTLIAIVENYAIKKHSSGNTRDGIPFEFLGLKTHFRPDHSHIWDSDTYKIDEEVELLDHLQNYLIKLGHDENKKELLQGIIKVIITFNKSAVIWRRLIISGISCPNTIGMEIRELAWINPILINYDTSKEIGDLITVIYPLITEEDREKIENAILAIPTFNTSYNLEGLQRIVGKLIGCIPQDLIKTKFVKQLISEFQKKPGGIPPNNPIFYMRDWESEPYDESKSLREQGIDIDKEQNNQILNLRKSIKGFIERNSNSTITIEEVGSLMPTINALKPLLEKADKTRVDLRLQELTWDSLAEACSIISKQEAILTNPALAKLVKEILIICSNHNNPILSPGEEEAFEKSVGWGLPAPRIQAAIGLMEISKYQNYLDEDLKATIRSLITDAVPAVRYQIVVKLFSLQKHHEDFMWEMVELIALNEKNTSILQYFVATTLFPLINKNNIKVMDLLINIYSGTDFNKRYKNLRNECLMVFLDQYLYKEDAISREIISSIVNNPIAYTSENLHLIGMMRAFLVIDSDESLKEYPSLVRNEIWKLLEEILVHLLIAYNDLLTAYNEKDEWNELKQKQINDIARIADHACKQVYFASGALNKDYTMEKYYASEKFHKSFFEEGSDVLDLLSEFGIPSITHNLIQTIEFFATLDPSKAFKRIGKIVMLGEEGGYQFESLGKNLIIQLIERYLSEFRSIFIEDRENNEILLTVLDVFVKVGWPEARRLTYKLDQLYR